MLLIWSTLIVDGSQIVGTGCTAIDVLLVDWWRCGWYTTWISRQSAQSAGRYNQ